MRPLPAPTGYEAAIERRTRPAALLRWLMFLVGAALPLISFERRRGLTASLLSRIEAVDVLCLLLVAGLLLSRRLRVAWPAKFYLAALAVSFGLGVAMSLAPRAPGLMAPVTGLAALGMASLYYIVGASAGEEPRLVRPLLAGVIAGALFESIIVFHDFFFPQWFQAIHSARVRGTFRATGQLGNYGFAVAGLMFAFGWVMFARGWARWLAISVGLLGIFFSFAASRRAAMFGILVWLAAFLLLGLRHMDRRWFWRVMGVSLVALVVLVAFAAQWGHTHMGQRFLEGVSVAASGESFAHIQWNNALERLPWWFPLGTGIGLGHIAVLEGEVHNGHLALAIELGLLGLAAFYSLYLRPFFRNWEGSLGRHSALVRTTVFSFLLGAALMMVHARLHRNREFMLFLGLASSSALTAAWSRRGRSNLPNPSGRVSSASYPYASSPPGYH